MSSYRTTAATLAQRAPGSFLGVALYAPIGGQPATWSVAALADPRALVEWYEEIAGSPALYNYLAAFDKSYGTAPVAETIAPPKPGSSDWRVFDDLRRSGYKWKPKPFVPGYGTTTVSGASKPSRSEIVPGLFIGSKPSPGRYDDVDVIVLAAMEYQPAADLFPGVEVLHMPLDDAPNRPLREDEIAAAVGAGRRVARRLHAGRRILASCQMGLNRSSLIAALALCEVYGMPADEIIKRIRRARGPWALSNPNFERLLRVVADVQHGNGAALPADCR